MYLKTLTTTYRFFLEQINDAFHYRFLLVRYIFLFAEKAIKDAVSGLKEN
jgi:hypothetical protein